MVSLVALDLTPGPGLVAAIGRTWADGDVVFVVDQRLDLRSRADLLAQVRPGQVVGGDRSGVLLPDPRPGLIEGDALVVASSGSTGRPKFIVHTRDGLVAHARAVHARLDVDLERDRWLACLPMAHLGGLGVVIRALLEGVGLDVTAGFDPAIVQQAPVALGSTLVSVVPTALDRLDVSGFRKVVVGGSADRQARPSNVVRTYGLTETGGGVVYNGEPIDGTEVAISGDGRISLRGPTVARGVWTDGGVIGCTDATGWLSTGDRGHWEGDHLVVDGRADDLIITGGENVWPAPVEATLATHSKVSDVAVIGLTDPEWGQRVVAVVVPRDAGAPPTLDELRAWVGESLPRWCCPRQLVLVDAIPRTALGKTDRPRLLTTLNPVGNR